MNTQNTNDTHQNRSLGMLLTGIMGLVAYEFYSSLDTAEKILFWLMMPAVGFPLGVLLFDRYSKWGKAKRKRIETIKEIPPELLLSSPTSIYLGHDLNLDIDVYLPDEVRCRHVHLVGGSGFGKTNTLQNFIKQDSDRGLGMIILDGKGEISFLNWLKSVVPKNRLCVFDLSDEKSMGYNPLSDGSPLEAAQRLYSSLTWSEPFYAAKARAALQTIFQNHFKLKKKNPSIKELAEYLDTPQSYSSIATSPSYPPKLATEDYMGIAGLRDQINSLCTGHLDNILSPSDRSEINLGSTQDGKVLYFRLQSSLATQIASNTGKLLINHINFLAGTAHRNGQANKAKLVPTYFDEFATFVCPEFADLISKARSAGYALHFSHQSKGDLEDVSKGFLGRITDNSATKIIMHINDPDSADFFAKSFGTSKYQKVTQRITNAKDADDAELVGEGSSREAHRYKTSPDELKSHPTGVGSVLIAHGKDTAHGASDFFKIRFPPIPKEVEESKSQTETNANLKSINNSDIIKIDIYDKI